MSHPTGAVATRPRPLWVGTSWKMTKTRSEALAWTDAVLTGLAQRPTVAAGLVRPFALPPHTALAEVAAAAEAARDRCGVRLLVGAQDAHWAEEGPWTGEVSVAQVADAGAELVEVGHSERRTHLGETDDVVARKTAAVVAGGLRPVLCVGEPTTARDAGHAEELVLAQVASALASVTDPAGVLVAYEPVWAIGVGGRPATPDDVAPVVAAVRARWGRRIGGVLYGGSVDADNASALLGVPGVDGLFAGRSAWRPEGFLALVDAAAQAIGSSGP